jgi:hypothetical protein
MIDISGIIREIAISSHPNNDLGSNIWGFFDGHLQ